MTVAVLGASANPAKFGNKAVRAYLRRGYHVFPINPREVTIEGQSVYRSLKELPEHPQVISVYLPPPLVLELMPEILACGCRELWLNPGSDSPEVLVAAGNAGLPVIQACSIVGLGLSPEAL